MNVGMEEVEGASSEGDRVGEVSTSCSQLAGTRAMECREMFKTTLKALYLLGITSQLGFHNPYLTREARETSWIRSVQAGLPGGQRMFVLLMDQKC